MIFQDPYESLNPRRTIFDTVSEPLAVQRLVPQGARGGVAEILERVGLAPENFLHVPLPARALGRPASAHRHRAGAHDEPELRRRRRADLDARRQHPHLDHGADDQARPGARRLLPVHHPRPRGRALHVRPNRRDVPREDRRDRADRGDARPNPHAPLHQGAAVGGAGAGPLLRAHPRSRSRGRSPSRSTPPRVPVHRALPVGGEVCHDNEHPPLEEGQGRWRRPPNPSRHS
jgi:hypothetical protein